jgi:hypothetical protein
MTVDPLHNRKSLALKSLSHSWRILTASIPLIAACLASLAGQEQAGHQTEPSEAVVVEVSGSFAKVALAGAGVRKGDTAELFREGTGAGENGASIAAGVVTAVEADYIVVRFDDAAPKKGDLVRFSSVGAAPGEEAEESAGDENPEPDRKSQRELRQERRAQLTAERQAKEEEVRQKWLARLEARGIEAWKTPTDEDHAAALARYKRMGEEVHALLPSVQLYETKYFLFYSNIPPAQVGTYIRDLDAMYVMMARLFGIPDDHDVWLGRKAPVFAFLSQQQFLGFEQKYFQVQPVGAYGICHQSPKNGEVVIACYRGDDPHDFGQMLVHETSHGFVFRYKTKAGLPVWVDEGMAEYIGEKMVPQSEAVDNKLASALLQLKQTHRIGANFFENEAQLAAWQYGVAFSMNEFLITSGQQRYVVFIEGMKEGLTWQESLRQAYNATPEEFLALYSRAMRLSGLGL